MKTPTVSFTSALSTDLFTWNRTERTLVAEASSLDFDGRDLTILSAHTGARVQFTVTEAVRDADNDLSHWILEPLFMGSANCTIIVYND